jgi:hypothetical protein
MGFYIYADESGNSGKKIFDVTPFYYQGAIFSIGDIQIYVAGLVAYSSGYLNSVWIDACEDVEIIYE